MDYFYQNEPVSSARMNADLRPWTPTDAELAEIHRRATNTRSVHRQDKPRSWPPTEKTLQWCREHIPHFETCEKQAKAAQSKSP